MEDSKSWAKPVVGVCMVIQWFRSFSVCVQTSENESKQQLSLSKWKESSSSRLSAPRVNVYVCETMPDAHAVRATAAAHPQVGTSRETTEVKKSSNPTAAVTRSGSVRICYALRWFSHSKRFQTSHFASCLSSGWEKFSPRRILSGPGGEGLSGPSTTSPRTRGVQDDSGGQRCAPSLRKETDFLWIITILEPQPRVRSARRSGKVYLRAAGRTENISPANLNKAKLLPHTFFIWTRSCSGSQMFDSAAGDQQDVGGVGSITCCTWSCPKTTWNVKDVTWKDRVWNTKQNKLNPPWERWFFCA